MKKSEELSDLPRAFKNGGVPNRGEIGKLQRSRLGEQGSGLLSGPLYVAQHQLSGVLHGSDLPRCGADRQRLGDGAKEMSAGPSPPWPPTPHLGMSAGNETLPTGPQSP